jgi:hypothetical protein
MNRSHAVCRLFLLACLGLGLLAGCAGSSAPGRMKAVGRKVTPGREFTRRGVERDFVATPSFGSARGRAFEDIIPVGARITAVHVSNGTAIEGIHLSYERNGLERETPVRGTSNGHAEVLKLDRDEKIIGVDAWGKGTLEGLTIATNKRTRTFGEPKPASLSGDGPWYATLTELDKERYVAIGITGRADTGLHQLSVRVQVRGEG